MKAKLFTGLFAICVVLFSFSVLAAENKNANKAFPLEQVKHGLTGYGISDLGPDVPNTFKFQVTSVEKDALGYGHDLIWALLYDNPKLKDGGVIAGMSGSPCYAEDGRFVGTVSYGYSNSLEVKAGITPAKDVLSVSDKVFIQNKSAGNQQNESQMSLLSLYSSGKTNFINLIQLDIGGNSSKDFSNGEIKLAKKKLSPGDPIGVGLVLGDYSIVGVGTVSAVFGKDVWIFGHPMFQFGEVNFPMLSAKTEDVTLLRTRSFKESSTSEVIGTLTQDRLSATYGHLEQKPDMIPITVNLDRSGKKETLHIFMIRQKQVDPILMEIVISGLLTEFSDAQELTVFSKGEISIKGDTTKNLYFSEHGDGLINDVVRYYAREFSDALNPKSLNDKPEDNNKPVRIESININLAVYEGDRTFSVKEIKVNLPSGNSQDINRSYSLDIILQSSEETKTINYPLMVPSNFSGKIEIVAGDLKAIKTQADKGAYANLNGSNLHEGSLLVQITYKNSDEKYSLLNQSTNHTEIYEVILDGIVVRGSATTFFEACSKK